MLFIILVLMMTLIILALNSPKVLGDDLLPRLVTVIKDG